MADDFFKAPSEMAEARTAIDLAQVLRSAGAALQAGYKLSRYYRKFAKVQKYIEGLRDQDVRSVTIAQMTWDVAVKAVSAMLGKSAASYFSVFNGYMTIAFSALKIEAISASATDFVKTAVKLSERQGPGITESLKRFDENGAAFDRLVSEGNAYMFGLWISRELLTERGIKDNPKAALEAVFVLRGAKARLDAAREPIDELIALTVFAEQIRMRILHSYAEYDRRVSRLENARGHVPAAIGKITRAMNEMDQMTRTGRTDGLTARALTREIDQVIGRANALARIWLEQDEKIERGILALVSAR